MLATTDEERDLGIVTTSNMKGCIKGNANTQINQTTLQADRQKGFQNTLQKLRKASSGILYTGVVSISSTGYKMLRASAEKGYEDDRGFRAC